MKTIGIMQPYLFPYLGYFQTIAAVDDYVLYDDVQFIKGGWINRNNILIGHNKVLFTVALTDASANKLINEISIADTFEKFQKTLAMAYSKAPHKEAVLALLQSIFNFPDKNLARFTGNSLMRIAEYIGIATTFHYSSDLKKNTSLKGQAKVISICKELGGERYINSIGGQELYDRDDFKAAGLELKFIKMADITYRQTSREFVPSLSIIDVLMFNTPAEIKDMLGRYELI